MLNSSGSQLDLFSITPTSALQERRALSSPCIYNAPFFAYQTEKKTWTVTQGNCHHWDCPRCGLGRAKQEYGRMVVGCTSLAKEADLFFITITCKGRELSWQEAEKSYGDWTNKLLDACRLQAKRNGARWHYVQVTERQKRRHPHSHFITTFKPSDTMPKIVNNKKRDASGKDIDVERETLQSKWFEAQLERSGLGEQYEITKVHNPEGASRYVAKYLFKPSIFENDWPPKWRRIRYSRSFPKLEEKVGVAIVLIKLSDWVDLSERALVVNCPDLDVYEVVSRKMTGADVFVRLKTK